MDIRPIDANALVEKLDNINPVDYGAMSSYETHCGARDALSDAVRYVDDAPTLSLNTLRDAIYQDAVAHGLWKGKVLLCYQTDVVTNEVMELLSASSAVILAETAKEKKKAKEHFNEELADIVIGCFSLAGRLGIDIDAAIRRKMEINKGRPWKHGKSDE